MDLEDLILRSQDIMKRKTCNCAEIISPAYLTANARVMITLTQPMLPLISNKTGHLKQSKITINISHY